MWWDDIGELESAKAILAAEIVLPMKLPHLFAGKRQPCNPTLLYGPHRTRQWLLAKAAAEQAGVKFICIDVSRLPEVDIFETARIHHPVIIFIDRIDALRLPRNEMLASLNMIRKSFRDTLVIGSTCIPWEVDSYILERFRNKLHITRVNLHARMKLLKQTVESIPCIMEDQDYRQLAIEMERFSDSEVKTTIEHAFMTPVIKIARATHHRPVNVEGMTKFTPCSPGRLHTVAMSWKEIDADHILEPPLMLEDCLDAVRTATTEIRSEELQKYSTWTRENNGID